METNVSILALIAFSPIQLYALLVILLAFNAPVRMKINALLVMVLLSYKIVLCVWLTVTLASAITWTLTFAQLALNFV